MVNPQLASLIKMVNEIALNNGHAGDEQQAAAVVAAHIRRFWARPMKQQICDYQAGDGELLSPVARLAVMELAQIQSQP